MLSAKSGIQQYYLKPGYIYISMEPVEITTVLGSCVAVCLFDKQLKLGGMNHYLLSKRPVDGESSSRYGDISLNYMIKYFIKSGSEIGNLSARIIGGAYMQGNAESQRISMNNIDIAKMILGKNNIKITSCTVGGVLGRKVSFASWEDKVRISILNEVKNQEVWMAHGTH